ncbi:helix-turn-helix domain-containing protein [Streptomyces sp. NPDC060188]|uniref:helix-turn-helix domain-containing protein n=1 Tax=Streptomyces sp. NPDC060188 TaxID=3347068 RepID=UPI0036511004
MESSEAKQALARLRQQLRERAGTEDLSPGDLSTRTRRGRTTISNALNDRPDRPSWRTVAAIATVLRFSSEEISALHDLWERADPKRSERPPQPSPPFSADVVVPETPSRTKPRGWLIAAGAAAVVLAVGIPLWLSGAFSADDKNPSSKESSHAASSSSGPVPLTFVADTPSWQCGDAVVVPGAVGASQMVPGPRPAAGVSASKTGLGFTVQGRDGQTVTLLGLSVDVLSKHEPLRGTRVPAVCQGDPPNRNLSVNLDQTRPQVVKAAARAGDGGSASDTGWPYTVSGSDPEHFVLQPSTLAHDVTFTLRLKWAWNGKRGELRIDDQGKPFRTTADRRATWLCPDPTTSTRLVPLKDGKTCAS